MEPLKYAFSLNSVPTSVDNCFGSWIKSFPKNEKKLVFVGVSAVFWTLRKCRNNVIFEKKLYSDPMILIKLICFWVVGWSILQIKEVNKEVLMVGARLLERVASEVYKSSQGWTHTAENWWLKKKQSGSADDDLCLLHCVAVQRWRLPSPLMIKKNSSQQIGA